MEKTANKLIKIPTRNGTIHLHVGLTFTTEKIKNSIIKMKELIRLLRK